VRLGEVPPFDLRTAGGDVSQKESREQRVVGMSVGYLLPSRKSRDEPGGIKVREPR